MVLAATPPLLMCNKTFCSRWIYPVVWQFQDLWPSDLQNNGRLAITEHDVFTAWKNSGNCFSILLQTHCYIINSSGDLIDVPTRKYNFVFTCGTEMFSTFKPDRITHLKPCHFTLLFRLYSFSWIDLLAFRRNRLPN